MSGVIRNRTSLARRIGRRQAMGVLGLGGSTLALALAGCGGGTSTTTVNVGATAASSPAAAGAATATPKKGGTLTTYLNSPSSEQLELHGLRSNSSNTQPYFALVYNTLLRFGIRPQVPSSDLTLEGALAQKWEQPDPTTLTFTLRPGVKFHNKAPVNGRALTSEDVKFTFERLLDSPFAYKNFYQAINAVETPSPDSVVFKLKQPDAALLPHLGFGYTWIIAREAGKPDDKGPKGLTYKDAVSAIGTGPFIADTYEHGVRFTANRNPDYFEQGLPYLDRVEYQVIQDNSAVMAGLSAGKLSVGTVPTGSVGDLKATNPKLTYQSDLSNNWYGTAMRTDMPPFNDVRVRRAMAMAWDQKNIAKLMEAPDSPPTFGSIPAGLGPAYLPLDKLGENAKWWQVNVQEAKQLLSAAGYANGFSTDYNGSVANQPTDYPEVFASDMAKIGIKVNLKIGEHAAFQATTLIGNYEGLGGYVLYVIDPDDFFSTLLPGSTRNLSHVNDPRLIDLAAKERTELDTNKRLGIVHEIVQYLAGQVYTIPKPQIVTTTAGQPGVQGYVPRHGYQPVFSVTWLEK